jgi:hypothetical protein
MTDTHFVRPIDVVRADAARKMSDPQKVELLRGNLERAQTLLHRAMSGFTGGTVSDRSWNISRDKLLVEIRESLAATAPADKDNGI